jgi:uncharacterized protein YaeQ
MALSATLRRFTIQLADSDRGVYEELDWRVPQHPSESERYLVARILARVLEHAEGVEFSKGGVSDDDEPAIVQKNLRGEWMAWIEVGAPTPDRLHKASKLAPRVAVYAWKNVEALAESITEREVHRRDELELKALPPEVLDSIAATIDRINKWDLSVAGGAIYLTINGALFELAVTVIPIA